MEYRRVEPPFDNNIPGSGIIFYRVNDLVDGNASTVEGVGCDEIYVFRKLGTPTWNGALSFAYFPNPTQQLVAFSQSSDPYPFACSGNPITSFEVSNFSAANADSITFTFNGAVSIEEMEIDSKISIYPNPTTAVTNLAIEDETLIQAIEAQKLTYHIFDFSGRTIAQDLVKNSHSEISLLNLKSGLYYLQIKQEQQVVKTLKVIKQ